ncbi:ATP synthase F1 subunit delta [bacterium]|nr:ATP synthase F1 subunit delta [bacterium]
MISNNLLAGKYALALFNNALKNNMLLKVFLELKSFSEVLTQESLLFFVHPKITKKEKKYFVSEILEKFGFSEETIFFICIIIDNNRIKLIPQIYECFISLKEKHEFLIRGSICVTKTVDEGLVEDIKKEFETFLNKKISWNVLTDNTLLGGFKIKIEDTVYDASVKNKIKRLSETIVNV